MKGGETMGIVIKEQVIAWYRPNQKGIYCTNCKEDDGTLIPIPENGVEPTDIVTCDMCGDRIK